VKAPFFVDYVRVITEFSDTKVVGVENSLCRKFGIHLGRLRVDQTNLRP